MPNEAEKSTGQSLLRHKAEALLNHCVSKSNWKPPYDSPVFTGFLDAFFDESTQKTWSSEVALDLAYLLLNEFSTEKGLLLPVHSSTVDRFINRFVEIMKNEVSENWVILPLHGAKLEDALFFENFHFLPSKLPREEKIKYLATILSISPEEMSKRAAHTEATRSPDFYSYTLLCHKILAHTEWVQSMSVRIGILDVGLLRVIQNSIQLKTGLEIGDMQNSHLERNRHIVIARTGHQYWWAHQPLWAGHHSTELQGDLVWLKEAQNQTKFLELLNLLNYEKHIDSLTYRFRKSVGLFNRAINIQLNALSSNEGFALEILHLMISAESLLLERENEKRLRLAVFLSRLIVVSGKGISEIYKTVDELYNWRSDYVHSGNDVFPEYDENFSQGDVQLKVYVLRNVISQLIADAPRWISLAQKKTISEEGGVKDRASEKAWFKYLNTIWQSALIGEPFPTK